MKVQIKIIDSNYNKKTGISKVSISTDIGIFNGISKLHPEDKEIASSFAGCGYAEIRAIISYMKEKKKITKYQLEILKELYNNASNRKNFNKKDITNKILREQIIILEDEYISYKRHIKTLKEKLNISIEEREKIIKKINEYKEKKNSSISY